MKHRDGYLFALRGVREREGDEVGLSLHSHYLNTGVCIAVTVFTDGNTSLLCHPSVRPPGPGATLEVDF